MKKNELIEVLSQIEKSENYPHLPKFKTITIANQLGSSQTSVANRLARLNTLQTIRDNKNNIYFYFGRPCESVMYIGSFKAQVLNEVLTNGKDLNFYDLLSEVFTNMVKNNLVVMLQFIQHEGQLLDELTAFNRFISTLAYMTDDNDVSIMDSVIETYQRIK